MARKIKLTIGEFSKFCRVTVKTLRHYEKLGLLIPNEVDDWTKYRYYDISQMQQLNGILRLKKLGFSLEEICDLQNAGTNQPDISQIQAKTHQVKVQLKLLQEQLTTLKNFEKSLRGIEKMGPFSIHTLPSIIVASHRRVLRSCYDLTPLCANIIGPEIQRIATRTLPPYCFSIRHEKEYKCENVDIEYCEQVEEMRPDTELIKFKRLPEIPTVLCIKSYGPYEHVRNHFIDTFKYINEHGYEVTAPYRAQYVEGPWNQKNPKKWLTIFQIPVGKAK